MTSSGLIIYARLDILQGQTLLKNVEVTDFNDRHTDYNKYVT